MDFQKEWLMGKNPKKKKPLVMMNEACFLKQV
jgi:hypothetical protein